MKDQLLLLADYHVWAQRTLQAAVSDLPEDDYRTACGLFFGSIHGTLNHLLLADRIWFARFTGGTYEVDSLADELETDRARLAAATLEQTARWRPWIAARAEYQLGDKLVYTNTAGKRFEDCTASVLLHVFNHGTHHRGQISAALSRFGGAAPEMDLVLFMRCQGSMPAPA